jgi:hypothetical protein
LARLLRPALPSHSTQEAAASASGRQIAGRLRLRPRRESAGRGGWAKCDFPLQRKLESPQ